MRAKGGTNSRNCDKRGGDRGHGHSLKTTPKFFIRINLFSTKKLFNTKREKKTTLLVGIYSPPEPTTTQHLDMGSF